MWHCDAINVISGQTIGLCTGCVQYEGVGQGLCIDKPARLTIIHDCHICQIRYKNNGTVTLSSIVQYEGVCWARALIWRTTYFRSTVTHISVDDKYQAVENDNCFVVGWWPA